jgi:uncharacterized protein (TIGR03067 family)
MKKKTFASRQDISRSGINAALRCCAKTSRGLRELAGMMVCAALVMHQVPAKAAEEFRPLFNGKDLSGWDGDPTLWSAKEGTIIGETTAEHPAKHNTFLIWTNGEVGDFELRCSFRITANNDKGFANSGIQYRSKVLEPKGWVVGGYQADMEAGTTYTGILYEERMTRGIMAARGERVVWDTNCLKRVVGTMGTSEEIQAMIKKNDWNDYLVRAEGNHLQHFINGRQTVDVTDNCEAKRAMKGVLALQLHAGGSMKVEFHDLRLKKTSGDHQGSAEEITPLQGSWQVAALEAEGSVVAPELVANVYITVKDNEFHVFNAGEEASGSFKLDATKKPGQIDIYCETGPDKGQTWPGIYEIGGDNFKVCYSRIGKKRPETFATAEDSGLVMINYKRKKA